MLGTTREQRLDEVDRMIRRLVEVVPDENMARIYGERLEAFRELRDRDRQLEIQDNQILNYHDLLEDVADGEVVSEKIQNLVKDYASALIVLSFFRVLAETTMRRTLGLDESGFREMALRSLRDGARKEPAPEELRVSCELIKFYQDAHDAWDNQLDKAETN